MKSLYESILGSTKSGKQKLVQEWCEKYQPFNGNYKINSKGEIERSISNPSIKLYLSFKDYTELPEYIQFADDEDLVVFLGRDEIKPRNYYVATHSYFSDIAKNITSFRGIPKNAKSLTVFTHGSHLPDLKISVNFCSIYASFAKSFGKIEVNLRRGSIVSGDAEFRIRDIGYGIEKWPKTLIVNNARTIYMVNAGDMGDIFSKLLNRKAPMNKYVRKYEFPVTDEGVKNIEDYFGNSVDLKTVQKIKYTQNSELVKGGNQWFRCKNRD